MHCSEHIHTYQQTVMCQCIVPNTPTYQQTVMCQCIVPNTPTHINRLWCVNALFQTPLHINRLWCVNALFQTPLHINRLWCTHALWHTHCTHTVRELGTLLSVSRSCSSMTRARSQSRTLLSIPPGETSNTSLALANSQYCQSQRSDTDTAHKNIIKQSVLSISKEWYWHSS